ncbi:MAG: alternative ribosome rescue aminoacyl-tRNA hydrolase ArfB [Phycisphaerales bacterium]
MIPMIPMIPEPPTPPPPPDPAPRPDPPPPPQRPAPAPPGALLLGGGAWVLPSSLQWTFSRAGGPGGQHVNTTSSKATLRVRLTDMGGLWPDALERLAAIASAWLTGAGELVIQADERRSQLDNREACLRRLRAVVSQAAVRPRARRATKPSRASRQRRLDAKKSDSRKKERRRWKDD